MEMVEVVTVSPNYEIEIPPKVRATLNLQPGQRLYVLVEGHTIRLIQVKPMREYRGIARGIDTDFEREDEDRV